MSGLIRMGLAKLVRLKTSKDDSLRLFKKASPCQIERIEMCLNALTLDEPPEEGGPAAPSLLAIEDGSPEQVSPRHQQSVSASRLAGQFPA